MTNPYQLNDDEKSFIESNSAPFEQGWHSIAVFTDEKIAVDHWPKMICYQAIGLIAHRQASTIRSWSGMRRAIGDELIDEYRDRYGIEHWRQIRRAAHRDGVTVAALADRFDTGASISPETLAVELGNGKREKRNPAQAAATRLMQAAASLVKHTTGRAQQQAIELQRIIERETEEITNANQ